VAIPAALRFHLCPVCYHAFDKRDERRSEATSWAQNNDVVAKAAAVRRQKKSETRDASFYQLRLLVILWWVLVLSIELKRLLSMQARTVQAPKTGIVSGESDLGVWANSCPLVQVFRDFGPGHPSTCSPASFE
jgi:hypothetical protein